ncbi:hypothetical protein FJY90_01500 [Candidatus Gottesmanbacteria bacterium]|nr:hypothetical protein [Candidatus Gottesmanbacteria bacterium]
MNILGISCYYHDAAAVLVQDGNIIAAAEEERFSRRKHDASFPKLAIDYCLAQGKITSSRLDYAVFYEKPFRKFQRIILSSLSAYPQSYKMFREAMRVWLTQKLWIKQEIASLLHLDFAKILFSEHHLSHAASCFYPSLFKKAAILTVDGVGEWPTASWGIGEENKISLSGELHYPQSLGLLYSTFTAFLGFEVNEGEWKVMGMAPYGKPSYTDKIWKIINTYSDGSFSLDLSFFSYQYSDKLPFNHKFVDLFGLPISPDQAHYVTQKSADIAASIQLVTEELLLSLAKYVKRKTNFDYLCFSGGVALNSVANWRILKKAGFKNIYIQPAAGDSGGALGAALYLYHHLLGQKKRNTLSTAYLGKQFTNSMIEQFLTGKNIKYTKHSDQELIKYVVKMLEAGKIVGWMQGSFEWGPRALGGRSILADPRNPRMKEIINAKVKFREAFRPFAPSVLGEKADLVFTLPKNPKDHLPFRFMLYVVPVKSAWRKKVPAITHIDNTSRPQLVYRQENPLYHRLISSFYQKTGVPLVLNTSFNLKGEPIVASPADAYSTFVRSGIDVLVMGNFICQK